MVWKQSPKLKQRLLSWPRNSRISLAVILLPGGAALLLGSFSIAPQVAQLIQPPSYWLAALLFAISGSIFVACQCIAGISLFTIIEENVTLEASQPSIGQEGQDR